MRVVHSTYLLIPANMLAVAVVEDQHGLHWSLRSESFQVKVLASLVPELACRSPMRSRSCQGFDLRGQASRAAVLRPVTLKAASSWESERYPNSARWWG